MTSAAAIFALASAAFPAAAQVQDIVILHDNDLHGHMRSFCYVETRLGAAERCGVGGAARRATLISRLRHSAHAPLVLIDAGDTSTRGPLSTEYEGMDGIAAMNAIGYDLGAVGNNEFKLKDGIDKADAPGAQAALNRFLTASRFPWLCANVSDQTGTPLPGTRPFVVRRMGRLKVAFLGLTTLKSVKYPQAQGLRFQDPIEAAKTWIPRARDEADVVIAVTHLGVDQDLALARLTPGLDAIVGGDSHTFLYRPLHETGPDGRIVPIVQDGEFGVRLGEQKLRFKRNPDGDWRLVHDRDRLLPVSSRLRPDPRIGKIVKRYAALFDVRVGMLRKVATTLPLRRRQTAEILAAAWKKAAHADIGLEPEDAPYDLFRSRLVTRYAVRAILPFHEDVVTVTRTGAELTTLLQQAKGKIFAGGIRLTLSPYDIRPQAKYLLALPSGAAERLKLPDAVDEGEDARSALEAFLKRSAQ